MYFKQICSFNALKVSLIEIKWSALRNLLKILWLLNELVYFLFFNLLFLRKLPLNLNESSNFCDLWTLVYILIKSNWLFQLSFTLIIVFLTVLILYLRRIFYLSLRWFLKFILILLIRRILWFNLLWMTSTLWVKLFLIFTCISTHFNN